jgi:hypothetical protein
MTRIDRARSLTSSPMADGILSGPIDVDPGPSWKQRQLPMIEAAPGTSLHHRGTAIDGVVVRFSAAQVVLRDATGRDHTFRNRDGDFTVRNKPVALRAPKAAPATRGITRSGSIDPGDIPARMARASRIYVEGLHDAELVEHVWGDDLRAEGVVVQPMDGMDELVSIVRGFAPGPKRRLGVLLDHLVAGTKERRIAAEVTDPNVLITGHPYVDIWQAVKPEVVGLREWPEIPKGTPWKEGILASIGWTDTSGAFWKKVVASVRDYRDLQPGLVGAVEQLIDFVAPPE